MRTVTFYLWRAWYWLFPRTVVRGHPCQYGD